MEIDKTVRDYVELIGEGLRANIKELDGSYELSMRGISRVMSIETDAVEGLLKSLSQKQEHELTAIYNTKSYEVLVNREVQTSRLGWSIMRRLVIGEPIEDKVNGITYILDRPSDEFLLFLIGKFADIAQTIGGQTIRAFLSPALSLRRREQFEEDEEVDIFHVLRSMLNLYTLQIRFVDDHTLASSLKYADSFFFQLSYNLDQPVMPQRHLDELVRGARINRIREASYDELEAPKRFYIPDLIYYYQLGVASDSPALEYLSYYHVAEYFFQEVFEEELIGQVRRTITQPDFSYKRKKDISKLIGVMTKSLKFQREEVTFSEQNALELTLNKYLSLGELLDKIKTYDKSLVDYYKNNRVGFCNGDVVDLKASDEGLAIKRVSKRVYETRNAIVHSKAGEKGRYIPFNHDKELVKEVPLLRFIAELIIINSSDVIS